MKVHENVGVNVTKMITVAQLQIGDIILSTTDKAVSVAIRTATSSKFSHARIYVGDSNIIEAVDPVVIEDSLKTVMVDDTYTYVYRMPNLTPAQKARILAYAREQRDKEYDLSGAIGSSDLGAAASTGILAARLENLVYSEDEFYCSELVAFAYKYAGAQLTFAASQTTPKDLARNKKLEFVGRLK